ncbi:unnamed protein product, partial [Rotaria sp. Silwood2]
MSTNNQLINSPQCQQVTTYLVFDDNEVQLIQVTGGDSKPVTFQNEDGVNLQATPIPGASIANRSITHASKINGHCIILSDSKKRNNVQQQQQQTGNASLETQQVYQNSSYVVTDADTNPTFDMNPPPIPNLNTLKAYDSGMSAILDDNNSSLDETCDDSTSTDINFSHSLSQTSHEVDHNYRQVTSITSSSKKKRGRPRLYKHNKFTNKSIRCSTTNQNIETTIPNITPIRTRLLPRPTSTTSCNNSVDIDTNNHFSSFSLQSFNENETNYTSDLNIFEDTQSFSSADNVNASNQLNNEQEKENFNINANNKNLLEHVESSIIIEKSITNHQLTSQLLDHDLPTDPRKWTINEV